MTHAASAAENATEKSLQFDNVLSGTTADAALLSIAAGANRTPPTPLIVFRRSTSRCEDYEPQLMHFEVNSSLT